MDQGQNNAMMSDIRLRWQLLRTTAPPHFTIAENGPGVHWERDTDIRQERNGFAPSSRDNAQETRTRTSTVDTSDPVNTTASQERRFETAPQA